MNKKYLRRGKTQSELRHGPGGRPLTSANWKAEKAEVQAFIQINRSHPGIKLATEWLDTCLKRASARDDTQFASRELLRLWEHGVTAEAVLAECAAVWLWWERSGRRASDPCLTYAVAHAVLRLAPRRQSRTASGRVTYPGASYGAIETLGKALRGSLYPLLGGITDHLLTRKDLTRPKQVAALKAPFPNTTDHELSEQPN
jgi:hypothetical protein